MARMTSSPAVARTALSGKEWRVLILLVISALINYIDRTTLSVAATDIQRELHLSNTQIGALQSAFFATYALSQLSFAAGWVVGRFHVGWVLGFGFLLWSGATAVTGFATVFAMIFSLRLLLGIGESVAIPRIPAFSPASIRNITAGLPTHSSTRAPRWAPPWEF